MRFFGAYYIDRRTFITSLDANREQKDGHKTTGKRRRPKLNQEKERQKLITCAEGILG